MLLHIIILFVVIIISLIFNYYILKCQLFQTKLLEGFNNISAISTIPTQDAILADLIKTSELNDKNNQLKDDINAKNSKIEMQKKDIDKYIIEKTAIEKKYDEEYKKYTNIMDDRSRDIQIQKTNLQNATLIQKDIDKQIAEMANWKKSSSIVADWVSVSISETGQYGIACAIGAIYYTSDYGKSWKKSGGTSGHSWSSVSISGTGQYAIAGCGGSDDIYYTSDYGQNWSRYSNNNFGSGSRWSSVSISGTGQYGIASQTTGYICYTSNSGKNWNKSNIISNMWTSVSISGTGQYGIACAKGNFIYYTSDYGQNWKKSNSISSMWTSVSISGTGQSGIACASNNNIYSTSDYGENWTVSNNIISKWTSVSISGTGKYGVACASDSNMYYIAP